MLAPFPGVPGVDPGGRGELRCGSGPVIGEGPVQAEPVSQGHRGQLERAEAGLEQPPGEFARQFLRRLFLDRLFR